MSGGLLVAGTTSDAGKSVLTAGICRWLHRQGVAVAPFKAQNMSNTSAVVVGPDGRGGELGRAQAMQAAACGLAPDLRFNPVLLKPGSDRSSQIVLLGEAIDTVTAEDFRTLRPRLAETAFAVLAELRSEYDVVVCEGAGSPAEINLRDADYANMGLARHARLPVIVVGDIDRGGVFASMFGTLALLDAEDQALVAGFVINKFRGDLGLLRPGLEMLHQLTGRPTYGVLPWHVDLWLDAEDALAYGRVLGRPAPPRGGEWLDVAVVRLPRISNATDAEALAVEPGVRVRLTVEDRRRRSRRAAGQQVDGRRPGVAAAHRTGRRRAPARLRRATAGRHLRRVPDALPDHPRPGRERARRGSRSRTAPRRDRLRGPEDRDPVGGHRVRDGAGARVRDPPRVRPVRRPGSVPAHPAHGRPR